MKDLSVTGEFISANHSFVSTIFMRCSCISPFLTYQIIWSCIKRFVSYIEPLPAWIEVTFFHMGSDLILDLQEHRFVNGSVNDLLNGYLLLLIGFLFFFMFLELFIWKSSGNQQGSSMTRLIWSMISTPPSVDKIWPGITRWSNNGKEGSMK